jgi:hypothetical protein
LWNYFGTYPTGRPGYLEMPFVSLLQLAVYELASSSDKPISWKASCTSIIKAESEFQ